MTTREIAEIAKKLNCTEKALHVWQVAFCRSATRRDSNTAYYVAVGHALDGIALTEENAREIGKRMGRYANRS